MAFVNYIITFLACTIGKICGMGGGVIIKPVLEAIGTYPTGVINILSGFAVMAMSGWSIGKGYVGKKSEIQLSSTLPLAVGACIGGFVGKKFFSLVSLLFANEEKAGGIQALLLFVAVTLTLVYTLNKKKIPSMQVKNKFWTLFIGLCLGMLGTFLGIGGGPFNMAVLFFFFSMKPKTAAQNSLFIILLSQLTGILTNIPKILSLNIGAGIVVGMVISGIIGSEVGGKINRHISNETVVHLLNCAMVLVMILCIYNVRVLF